MKVVFLGCGYLGYNLSEELKSSHDVEVWGLKSAYSEKSSCFVEVDVFKEGSFEKHKERIKGAIVIDTVSIVPSIAKSTDEMEELIKISKLYQGLFDQLHHYEIERYYFLSSGGTVYGECDLDAVENQVLNPQTLYAKSKVMLENLLMESQLSYLILRVSNPYGGYQLSDKKQGVIPILIEKAMSGESFELWSEEDSCRDYLYIEDMAEIFNQFILKQVKDEVVNVASGVSVTMKELLNEVESELGKINVSFSSSPNFAIHKVKLSVEKLFRLTGYTVKVSLHEGIKKEIKRIKEEKS